jgi:hypothetical protein
LLESFVVDQDYIATGLLSATTYRFKVKARNSVGYSEISTEVAILAA